ncbi:serine/threonine-protein kinase [Actinomadura rifamycini]|uniref:serine/threonine-protein kinase n=1 Tax=Actinomadura rifamycini TaxID=31962 RepID=UPI000687EDCE|nr:serine/threonine-protein kinase [Actinomadura rifamycini]
MQASDRTSGSFHACAPLTSRDPERIGAHRLLGRLGEGGQGVVYLAEDPGGDRVAVKILHDRAGSRDAARKELAAARRVAPFCTAEIRDSGEDDGVPYVVTEYIDGPSLRRLVETEGPQRGPSLYRFAIGTATALAAIHQAGIVHRDFKPGNVLVGPDGPRVIDFGVARAVDATATASGSVIGTPSYMAPEQLAGDTVGPAADVFAWAATIAFAANGRPPFGQDTIPAVLNRIVRGEADLGGLGGPLRDLVRRSLHKNPARRPTGREILLRLLEHSDGPIAAQEALARGRALATADDATLADERTERWTTVRIPRPHGRGRRGLLAGGIVAVVIAVAGGAALAVDRAGAPVPGAAPDDGVAVPAPPSGVPVPVRTAAAAPGAVPTAPAEVADAVEGAVGSRRTAGFTAEGFRSQSDEAFEARGRLHYRPGQSTGYDLTVRHPHGDPLVGDSVARRVIILGNCAYLRDAPKHCHSTESDAVDADGSHVWMASNVRLVSSPYNVLELLRASTSLQHDADGGTVTFRGTARGGALAESGPVGAFYRSFGGNLTQVTYTLVTTRDHLPKRLDIDLWTALSASDTVHSLYSVTYGEWGNSGTITRPY